VEIWQFLGKFWAKNIDAYRFGEISPAGAIPGQNIALGKIFSPQNNDTYGPWPLTCADAKSVTLDLFIDLLGANLNCE
jgi:hypothetical protein